MTERAWLLQLKDLRRTANQPTLREMEVWTQIPRNTLNRIFTGRTLPTEVDVLTILSALDANTEEKWAVVNDVRAARAEQRANAGKRRTVEAPVNEVAELTAAIRELTEEIRALRRERPAGHRDRATD